MERAQRSTIAWFAVAVAIIALVINAVAVRGSGSSTVAAAATTPTVQVTLKEFSITPSSLTAAPGPLKITVTNAGTTVHNFSITGLKATRDLNPGESQTLDVDVKAGHYEIQCTIPGHSGSGMKAMLMVAEGAPAASADSAASTDSPMSWQDMDKAMADVAKSFPAATKGHGGEPLAPTVLADGTKEFDLTAQVVLGGRPRQDREGLDLQRRRPRPRDPRGRRRQGQGRAEERATRVDRAALPRRARAELDGRRRSLHAAAHRARSDLHLRVHDPRARRRHVPLAPRRPGAGAQRHGRCLPRRRHAHPDGLRRLRRDAAREHGPERCRHDRAVAERQE